MSAHPLEPSTNDLLGALLNATYQQNELLAQVLQHAKEQAEKPSMQQVQLANWKKANPELSKRVGQATQHLNDLFQEWVDQLCEEAMELESDDPFNLREFLDKYGALIRSSEVCSQVYKDSVHENLVPSRRTL